MTEVQQAELRQDVRLKYGTLITDEGTWELMEFAYMSGMNRAARCNDTAPVAPIGDAVPVDYKAIAHEAANLAARIPGATFYNAAEFALNIVQERAAPTASRSADAQLIPTHQLEVYLKAVSYITQYGPNPHFWACEERHLKERLAAPIASALPAQDGEPK